MFRDAMHWTIWEVILTSEREALFPGMGMWAMTGHKGDLGIHAWLMALERVRYFLSTEVTYQLTVAHVLIKGGL